MFHHYNILIFQNQISYQSNQSLLGKCLSIKRQLKRLQKLHSTPICFRFSNKKLPSEVTVIYDPYNSKSVMEVEGSGCVLASKEICLL